MAVMAAGMQPAPKLWHGQPGFARGAQDCYRLRECLHDVRNPRGAEKQNRSDTPMRQCRFSLSGQGRGWCPLPRDTAVPKPGCPTTGAGGTMWCHSSKPAWMSLWRNVLLPTENQGQAGCGQCGAEYQLGTEAAVQDTSWGSAWEYGPLLLPPKSPAGRAEALPKQWQERLPSGPLPRHFPCQEAAGTPRPPLSPSSVPATTKPPLLPCAFAVSPQAERAVAGAKLPPARPQAGACQPPPWLSRKQHRSDGQQISVLQQMPRAVSQSPNLPVHLHQGEIMAGASSYGATCSTTLSPSTSLITGQGAPGMSSELERRQEQRLRQRHAAWPLPAPGRQWSWDKSPLAVLCLRARTWQPGHVPLPAASPTPLPAQQGGTSRGCSFRREGSDSTSSIPVPWQGGGGEEAAPIPAAMVPIPLQCWQPLHLQPVTSYVVLPLWMMLFGDAATPLSYCCLCGGWRVSSLQGLSPAHEKPHRAFLRGSLSCVE